MATEIAASQVMKFHSDALEDGKLEITALSGSECISKPYQFFLELASEDKDIDLESIIHKPAYIAIKQGVKQAGSDKRAATTVKIHGIIESIEQAGRHLDAVQYRALLVPRLWKLSLSHNSRIFQDTTVPDMVKKICDEYGVTCDIDKLSGYKEREYIVQYEESDFDFIHRWLEHEGIYYYFTQDDDEEKVVFRGTSEGYGTLIGDNEFRYKPQQGNNAQKEGSDSEDVTDDWFKEEVVTAISCTQKQLPKEVVLNDYNWRTPKDKLDCKSTVSAKGIGTVYEFNNHYSDKGEGKKLADVRAEEINCRELEYRGTADARGFRAGMVFKLKAPDEAKEKTNNGLSDAFYQEYLLVEIAHTATQSVALGSGNASGATYTNTFLAIPKSKTFRPPCVTAWPSIKGVLHGVIDGEDGGTPYAQIDDKGRYKVRLPLDRGDAGDGNASRWVRKAESYAGPSQGMHFPLLKGAEVLITHIDGDPDRPIISGAVYNEQNTSVVHQHNHTHNTIVTPVGNTLTLDDTQGAPQISLFTTSQINKLFIDGTDGSEKIEISSGADDQKIIIDKGNENIILKAKVSGCQIRIGKSAGEGTDGKAKDADGMRLTTGGEYNIKVGGDMGIEVTGKKEENIAGDSTAKTLGASWDLKIGDYNVTNFAAKFATSVGATATIQVGAELKAAYALSASITRGDGVSATWGKSIKLDKSKSFSVGKDDWTFKVAKKWEAQALGNCKLESLTGEIEIDAMTKLVLKCGASKIEMTPAGIKIVNGGSSEKVTGSGIGLKAPQMTIKSMGNLQCKGTPGGQYK